jgi:hypothetical protein
MIQGTHLVLLDRPFCGVSIEQKLRKCAQILDPMKQRVFARRVVVHHQKSQSQSPHISGGRSQSTLAKLNL